MVLLHSLALTYAQIFQWRKLSKSCRNLSCQVQIIFMNIQTQHWSVHIRYHVYQSFSLYFVHSPRLKYCSWFMFAISSGIPPVRVLLPIHINHKNGIVKFAKYLWITCITLRTNIYLYHEHCLPISNVVTELSAPNTDGIGPSKALLPENINGDDV